MSSSPVLGRLRRGQLARKEGNRCAHVRTPVPDFILARLRRRDLKKANTAKIVGAEERKAALVKLSTAALVLQMIRAEPCATVLQSNASLTVQSTVMDELAVAPPAPPAPPLSSGPESRATMGGISGLSVIEKSGPAGVNSIFRGMAEHYRGGKRSVDSERNGIAAGCQSSPDIQRAAR